MCDTFTGRVYLMFAAGPGEPRLGPQWNSPQPFFAKDVTDWKPGETIVFSYVVFKSRAHRDKVNAKVMKDPRISEMCDPTDMPFDCTRMLYGGFKTIVEA